MAKVFVIAVASALGALFALGAVAHARPLPNDPAAIQYIEAVPGGGGKDVSPIGAAAAAGPGTPKQRAAAIAKATKPAAPTAAAPQAPGESSTSGLGIVLPLLMIVTLLAGISLFVARRRAAAAAA